ncbi:hypothetical protein KDH_23860 [Dictyobacter sp. S3.2.2.5]|uniref:Carrier domain-containing protein n=1 Tax=Dictyobacter halimunensis TaxID=3026934 RepID=A0ABQ6FPB8_9CHLR|nr:hypothetical protein KDH_23860 [Dictyobacter sp. S3.2.2.5]
MVGCCVYEIPAQDTRNGAIPIGRPIANTQLYILDEQAKLVPAGGIGELYIGGVGVARGYQGRADLTAERFVPDPFSQVPGSRLYKTGDLVHMLPGGDLVYLGRNDQQIKLHGFRIEPEEIVAVLTRHPAVRDALVVARENSSGAQQLVAYLLNEADQPVSGEEVQRYLRKNLPEYLVPAAYVFLDEFPIASTGKVDRQALPDPEVILQTAYEAPITPIEETLATIWKQVLHVERVGRHDDFFALGGQSLLATQIISHVRRELQTEMPLRTLFAAPTIASFAEAIIQQELAEAENTDLLQILAQLGELPTEN